MKNTNSDSAAPAGKRFARSASAMKNTEGLSERLVRLPLWVGLEEVEWVAYQVLRILGEG